MIAGWQVYLAFSYAVGAVVNVLRIHQGGTQLEAFRDGVVSLLLAPMVAMLLIVGFLSERRQP